VLAGSACKIEITIKVKLLRPFRAERRARVALSEHWYKTFIITNIIY
jgi:hypothetical protein